jgi:hypothetical protein
MFSKSATLNPGGDLLRISLGGTSTGGPAPLSLSPSSSDFGSVAVGTTSSAVTFTVAVQGALACSEDAAEAGAKYAPLLVGWPSYARTLPMLGTGIAIVDAGLPEPMDSSATTRHLRP